jgi:hypothetical protein
MTSSRLRCSCSFVVRPSWRSGRTDNVQLGNPLGQRARKPHHHMMFGVAHRGTTSWGVSLYLPSRPAISPSILGDGWVTPRSSASSLLAGRVIHFE